MNPCVRVLFIPLFFVLLPVVCRAENEMDFLDDDFYKERLTVDTIPDPLEPLNRAMFAFNDVAYAYVLDPVVRTYSEIVAPDFRMIINNFFYNLDEPVRFVNCLLQGRFEDSARVLGRFTINTIFGVFGLGDPARTEFSLHPIEASLGESMEVWGIGDGSYLVVPLYGSSTIRDFSGAILDACAGAPFYSWADDYITSGGGHVAKKLNQFSFHVGEYDDLKKMSFDPYIAVRNGYMQYRYQHRNRARFVSED
ncbi:MAG: ABC transporter [Desulfobulbus propionicus]|nr:MAG: ABC transporter [Desulfobulbus propionicus]